MNEIERLIVRRIAVEVEQAAASRPCLSIGRLRQPKKAGGTEIALVKKRQPADWRAAAAPLKVTASCRPADPACSGRLTALATLVLLVGLALAALMLLTRLGLPALLGTTLAALLGVALALLRVALRILIC